MNRLYCCFFFFSYLKKEINNIKSVEMVETENGKVERLTFNEHVFLS